MYNTVIHADRHVHTHSLEQSDTQEEIKQTHTGKKTHTLISTDKWL